MPRSLPKHLAASFSAPQVTVVTPLLCQSKPSTQPKAWNNQGSDMATPTNVTAGSGVLYKA